MKGANIVSSEKKNKRYYCPEVQPDALGNADSFGNIEWTSEEIIDNIYEKLRLENKNYITRELLGNDESGNHKLWCYYFTPDNYELTVYLQAGVHGYYERQSVWGLARVMHLIASAQKSSEELYNLRNKVRFIVVPIVNPWSISVKDIWCKNSSGANLNRDCLNKNPQAETKCVLELLDRLKNQIDFGFDCHTNPGEIVGALADIYSFTHIAHLPFGEKA